MAMPCSICLGRLRRPKHGENCDHRFCTRCIDEWAKRSDTCPVCRKPLGAGLAPRPATADDVMVLIGRALRHQRRANQARRSLTRRSPTPSSATADEPRVSRLVLPLDAFQGEDALPPTLLLATVAPQLYEIATANQRTDGFAAMIHF